MAECRVVQPCLLTAEDKQIVDTFHSLSPQMKELFVKTIDLWRKNDRF